MIILVILLIAPSFAFSSDIAIVPMDFQYKMILKIVSFDRNFKKKNGKIFVIGLFKCRSNSPAHEKEFYSILRKQRGKTVNNLSIKFKTITEKELISLTPNKISLLLFLPEIKNIKYYVRQIEEKGILTAGMHISEIIIAVTSAFELSSLSMYCL